MCARVFCVVSMSVFVSVLYRYSVLDLNTWRMLERISISRSSGTNLHYSMI